MKITGIPGLSLSHRIMSGGGCFGGMSNFEPNRT